jgi:two-component system, OmpR family, copper resistance phosphate regulon response regulator CusR
LNVLIVEDEPRVASFLAKGLSDRGHAITCVGTGRDAVHAVRTSAPDLVLLDIGLPDMQGWDVLRAFAREQVACSVIVLTARGEVDDRVRGLHLGADDYLAKPFAFSELLARIHAVLRRRGAPILEAGGVALDLRTQTATVGGRAVRVTPQEMRLLAAFLRRPGTTLPRDHLLAAAWDLSIDPGTNLVDVHVRALRRKLGPSSIEAVRGVGYRFLGVLPSS